MGRILKLLRWKQSTQYHSQCGAFVPPISKVTISVPFCQAMNVTCLGEGGMNTSIFVIENVPAAGCCYYKAGECWHGTWFHSHSKHCTVRRHQLYCLACCQSLGRRTLALLATCSIESTRKLIKTFQGNSLSYKIQEILKWGIRNCLLS